MERSPHSHFFNHMLVMVFFLVLGAFGAKGQRYFVISYTTDWYQTYMGVDGNNNITAVAPMDARCLWELTDRGYLRNVATGRYVKANGTTLSTVAGAADTPTAFTHDNGTLAYTGFEYTYTEWYYSWGWRSRAKPSTYYFLGFDNNNNNNFTGGKIISSEPANYNNSNYSYTYSASAATATSLTQYPARLDVEVRADSPGDMLIAMDETTGSYTSSKATYTPMYYYYNDRGHHYFYYVNGGFRHGDALPQWMSTPQSTAPSYAGMAVSFSWHFTASLEGISVSDGGVASVNNRPSTDHFSDIIATVTADGSSASDILEDVMVEGSGAPLPVIVQTGDTPGGGMASIYTEFRAVQIYYTVGDLATPPADPTDTESARMGGDVALNNATGRYELASDYHFTSSPVVIKAVSVRGDSYSEVVIDTLYLSLPAPTISPFAADYATLTGSANIVAPGNVDGATVAYTTDGTDPDYSIAPDGTITPAGSTLLAYCATTGCSTLVSSIPLFDKVKAVAVKNGWHPSPVASSTFTMSSGINGNTAVLMDLEDHRWSYYSGTPGLCDDITLDTPSELRSLQPMNIKIVYKAGSVGTSNAQLSHNEAVDEFDYYETLERNTNGTYSYTTIANPFSKRPSTGSGTNKKYYGFNGWKLTGITGGTSSLGTGTSVSVDGKEADITFTPSATPGVNAIAMTVEFTAQWAEASVVTTTASNLQRALANGTLSSSNSFERNFVVVTGGGSSTSAVANMSQKNVTISMRYPDGTAAGSGNISIGGNFTCYADTKFEYININRAGTYIANNHYLCLGRGIVNTSSNYCVNYVIGFSHDKTYNYNVNYTIRIESGVYNDLSVLNGTESNRGYSYFNGTDNNVKLVLGCDYDRANNGNNDLLELKRYMYMSYWSFYRYNGTHNFHAIIKSGKFQTDNTDEKFARTDNGRIMAHAHESFYVSTGGEQRYPGYRYLEMQGGELCNIAGGIDQNNNANELSFYFRMKGGLVRGSVYGAGAFAAASGHRKYVITGGHIRGWVAGGCNGTDPAQSGGTLPSNTYIYVGGNAIVGKTSGAQDSISFSRGGNIFGAGSGNTQATTGQVNNTTVVVADDALVMKNVYAGGNRGYAQYQGNVYILGGRIKESVYGGSNMKGGATTRVYVRDGVVEGSVYGGSNTTGTISGTAQTGAIVEVTGGEVKGSVYGGGRGHDTRVTGDVAVTIGKAQTASCVTENTQPTIGTDVYGGSEEGTVNGTDYSGSRSTTVSVHRGTVKGDVYGGGHGTAAHEAHVYGNVTVTVGDADCSAESAAALGKGPDIRGSVFGCNNVSGKPQGTVRVNINGGEMENVYGGGNNAPYGDGVGTGRQQSPHVVITAGVIRNMVFGGGLGTGATVDENTDVHVLGSTVVGGNVYGGGNGAVVTGSTHVEIGGDCTGIESKLVP